MSKAKPDTVRLMLLNRLTENMQATGDYTSSLNYGTQALELAKSFPEGVDRDGLAAAYNNLGIIYMNLGDYTKALDCYLKTLKITEQLGKRNDMAADLGNIGLIYFYQEDYPKALEYYFKALKISESLNSKYSIATKLNNIGGIYLNLKEYGKALEYYNKALKLDEELKDQYGIAADLGNIGIIYQNQDKYTEALDCYFKALRIGEELGDKATIQNNLGNIGTSYSRQFSVSLVKNTQAELFKKAEIHLKKALDLATETGDLNGKQEWHFNLSELYAKRNLWTESLSHYKSYILARDSLFNEENTKKQVQLEMNYEFEKKEAVMKLEQEKKEAVTAAESRKQKIVIWSICGVLLLVTGFAVFAYRSYLQKQKANIEITKQKHIIEEKQKEILDSIYYARRIQRALVTSEKYVERNMRRMNTK